jgi:hypothetical protein
VSLVRTTLALGLFLLLALPILAPADADECESCHGGSDPSAGYLFGRPAVTFNVPSAVRPNATMDIILAVKHLGTYELKDFVAVLDLSRAPGVALASGQAEKKTLANMDTRSQTHGLTWPAVSGTAIGQVQVAVNVSYTVHYSHNSGGSKDTASYSLQLSQPVKILTLPFDISPGALQASQGKPESFTVNITAQTDLYNLELVPGLSIKNFTKVEPAKVGTLAKGKSRTVTVSMTPDRALEHGALAVVWSLDKAGANMSTMFLNVAVAGPGNQGKGPGPQENLRRVAARALGFTGLIVLILLMPTGGFLEPVKRALNKAMGGAKRRVDLHCALSYLLLTIGLLHSALLMYGHYKNAMWNGVFLVATSDYLSIDLGTMAIVLMVVISLLGIFQKRLGKVMGRKAWGRVHGILSYTALALIVVHLLWIGSTAAPIRTLFMH